MADMVEVEGDTRTMFFDRLNVFGSNANASRLQTNMFSIVND